MSVYFIPYRHLTQFVDLRTYNIRTAYIYFIIVPYKGQ